MEERKKPGQVAAKFREPAGLKILHNFHLCDFVEGKLWRLPSLLPSPLLGDQIASQFRRGFQSTRHPVQAAICGKVARTKPRMQALPLPKE